MKNNNFCQRLLVYSILLLQTTSLLPVSLVYSLKIRRAFDARFFMPLLEGKKIKMTALPIFFLRDRHIVVPSLGQDIREKVVMLGSIFNVRGTTESDWWAEITTGVENEKLTSSGTDTFKISETGMDDVIVSAGKNFFLMNNKLQIIAYGLVGFPFKQAVTPSEAQATLVGTRFYGLGAGAEASYAFIKKVERSLIGFAQVRLVHFFNRKWYPILPFDARLKPGNITDVFVVLRYREAKNAFEAGYNPTFFTNQGARLQTGTVDAPNFLVNSLYLTYERLFEQSFLLKAPGSWSLGLNVGRSNTFNTKITAGWFDVSLFF